MPYHDSTYPQPSADRNPVGTHTEGPWSIGPVQWLTHQPTGCGYAYRPIVAGTWEVAQVWEDEFDGEMTANVHLIAAAPDLLAACTLLQSYWKKGIAVDGGSEVADMISRALLKAKKGS